MFTDSPVLGFHLTETGQNELHYCHLHNEVFTHIDSQKPNSAQPPDTTYMLYTHKNIYVHHICTYKHTLGGTGALIANWKL